MERASSPAVRAALLVAVFLAAAGAFAHEGHHHPSPTPSPSASASAPASGTSAASTAPPSTAAPAPSASPSPAPFHLDLREALLSHLHNKIVHFPLGLGFAAAVILLVSPRWPQYAPAGRVLLVVAAAFSVAAYFTGDAQLPPFRGTPLEGIAERHEQVGIITAVALGLGAALVWVTAVRRWLWLYALVLIGLLSATGFLGGILAHTEF